MHQDTGFVMGKYRKINKITIQLYVDSLIINKQMHKI